MIYIETTELSAKNNVVLTGAKVTCENTLCFFFSPIFSFFLIFFKDYEFPNYFARIYIEIMSFILRYYEKFLKNLIISRKIFIQIVPNYHFITVTAIELLIDRVFKFDQLHV